MYCGGPNANFYRNQYNLWFSRRGGGGGLDSLLPLWIRTWVYIYNSMISYIICAVSRCTERYRCNSTRTTICDIKFVTHWKKSWVIVLAFCKREVPGSVFTGRYDLLYNERHNWAVTCDFQPCGILTSVDSDEPLQPPFKLRNSKWCSSSSFTFIKYSND